MKKELIRNIASVATLAAGVGLAIGIPLGLYVNRDKTINLGKYKTNYVLNNQSKDQTISIKPTYDRKENGIQYEWYVKTNDNSNNNDVATLSNDDSNDILQNELDGYTKIPNANEKDFVITKEMMQLIWMKDQPNQNLTFKCKVMKNGEQKVTDEINVFVPRQVISITQPMLETFMYSVGSFFTKENVENDIDKATGIIKQDSELFNKIVEYFLLTTDNTNKKIISEIKLNQSHLRSENPDDYIVDFEFELNPEYTWIKSLYSNDNISSYFVSENDNVLHLNNVNIQQNLYVSKEISYSQDDLNDFVDFINSNFTHLNLYANNKQTLDNSN